MLLTEVLREIDGYMRSSYYHKERGRKLSAGPAFDYDLSMGQCSVRDGWRTDGWHFDIVGEDAQWERLWVDEYFQLKFFDRYDELRRGQWSDVLTTIDETVVFLNESRLETSKDGPFSPRIFGITIFMAIHMMTKLMV